MFTPNKQAGGISNSENVQRNTTQHTLQVPAITLPKGGGALKGIDEKFEVNTSNGTATFTIPLPITTGRQEFQPSLVLSYNSGGGNSPFGLGWSVDLPIIQRRTDKQLPQYNACEEDTFMLSGGEDLVPYLEENDCCEWQEVHTIVGDFTIKRYRPRIENDFPRIEKISHPEYGIYWRVMTRENITTFYGSTPESRIADPTDATVLMIKAIGYSTSIRRKIWIMYLV